jgi:hypothetical protein
MISWKFWKDIAVLLLPTVAFIDYFIGVGLFVSFIIGRNLADSWRRIV